jgi:hypothetical protein
MKEIADTMEQAKKYAMRYIEVPPHAKFEIRWSTHSPTQSTDQQVLDGIYNASGPMLIACLTD